MANTNKKILIHNKFYKLDQKINKDLCHNNNDVQSADRLYSIIDQILSFNIKIKNSLLNLIFNYWFFNNDFQKERSLSNKKINKLRFLINFLFFLCVIGLIICLIFGVAIPIIQSTSDSLKLLSGKLTGKLVSNGKIIGFVISQSEGLNVVQSAKTILESAKDNPLVLDLPDNIWIKYYLLKYYNPYFNLDSSDLTIGINNLLTYLLNNAQSAPIPFLSFNDPLKILSYWALVNSSLNENKEAILSSFNGQIFANLPIESIFYGLKATNICLTTDQASQVTLILVIWQTWFSNANVIVPLIFTLFFIFIVWFHYKTIKKNKPKYTSMSMYNFVSNKAKFAKRYEFLLKKLVFLNSNINELKHNFILNFNSLDKTSIYNSLRLLNYIYSTIESISIVLVFDYDEKLLSLYQTIINDETKNLAITIISENNLNKLTSNKLVVDQYNKKEHLDLVIKSNEEEIIYSQYKNYLLNYLDYWENNNEFDIFKTSLTKLMKSIKKVRLTQEQEKLLIKEVRKSTNISKKNMIWNKTKISLKSFNPEINNLINKVINQGSDNEVK